ncbi:hypothetical protein BFW01_g5893 [Lasiodiplodia theobromae]|nr:hypothetical protein BFW01_g5893 [Lasiodiplodia theobromae]
MLKKQVTSDTGRADNGNIFHHLVRGTKRWDQEDLKKVLAWFFPNEGDVARAEQDAVRPQNSRVPFCKLLEERDSAGMTAMHMALASGSGKNPVFVAAILGLDNPPPNLSVVLCMKKKSAKENCLHAAISGDSEHTETIIRVVDNAYDKSQDMLDEHPFEACDAAAGNTPLHMAIKKVTATRLQSLWKYLSRHNLKLLGACAEAESNDPEDDDTENDDAEMDDQASVRDRRAVSIVEALIKSRPHALAIPNTKRRTPYQERIRWLESEYTNSIPDEKEESSGDGSSDSEDETGEYQPRKPEHFRHVVLRDPIASFISYYCIKEMDRNKAIDCLYHRGRELAIDFNLAGFPQQAISHSYLARLQTHLRFERTLKYVALPRLTVTKTNSYSRNAKPPSRKGRDDMKIIFKWLHERGVRKILKVTVIDNEFPAHKDASIVDCLKDFNVEVWDWKKVDLCSEVIAKSTSVAKEISLYSSGNQAVLKGWSAPGGFSDRGKFPELTNILLYLREGQEDRSTLESYGDELKEELESSVPESDQHSLNVDIIVDTESRSYSSQIKTKLSPSEIGNSRIDQMKMLTKFLREVEHPELARVRPVKIAIIDDGFDSSFDMMDIAYAEIETGNSFWPSFPESAHSYYVPSGNHGTQIASLICQLCPRSKLYIARLEEQFTQSGHRVINAASAKQAVEWATSCDVDIICMSWTIETPGANLPDDFKSVIEAAKAKGIVMFCAASDQGGSSSTQCYPGAFEKTCIRIGSCSSSDVPSAWVHHELVDFLLPGENIQVTNIDGTPQAQQGSSFATAIASGLGGLLIYLSLLLEKLPATLAQDEAHTAREGLAKSGNQRSVRSPWNYERMMIALRNSSIEVLGVNGRKLVKPEFYVIEAYKANLKKLPGVKRSTLRLPLDQQTCSPDSLKVLQMVMEKLRKEETPIY